MLQTDPNGIAAFACKLCFASQTFHQFATYFPFYTGVQLKSVHVSKTVYVIPYRKHNHYAYILSFTLVAITIRHLKLNTHTYLCPVSYRYVIHICTYMHEFKAK